MKKFFFFLLLFVVAESGYAQFGVSIHQSNLPFVGFNYQIKDRFLPELRLGTDNTFNNTSLELALNYIFKRDEIVNAYVGIGGRTQIIGGLLVPIGLNIYPFDKKNFGFQMELAPILSIHEPNPNILRGSWGLRYRFLKE